VESPFDRFAALVRRELGASDVRLLDPAETPPDAPNVAHHKLGDARTVLVTFESEPSDIDALRRRLAMLVEGFAEALADPACDRFRAARTPVSSSLHEELRALSARAQSLDVVVIDADSPIVWGSSRRGVLPSRRGVPLADVSHPRLVDSDDPSAPELSEVMGPGLTPPAPGTEEERTIDDALAAVRKLAEEGQVHRGRPLRHAHLDQARGLGYLALSFSGIYLLVLVYQGTFDELRAERAAQEALPRIERLVLALPPLDPEPQPAGQVVSLRRRR
jgi:hypothetical protein